jgi:hypothetical protein
MKLFVYAFLANIACASVDPVHGPREHPILETFGYDLSSNISELDQQLWEAVLQGDLNLQNISSLLTNGADPNSYDDKHQTAMHRAAWKGQRLAISLLCSRGAFVDIRDAWSRTPIHFAAAYGNAFLIHKVILFMTSFITLEGRGEDYPSTITALYFCGANFNVGDQSHNTPLHLAAAEGHAGTVRQLVKYGAILNATNLWGEKTPLGAAEEVCITSNVSIHFSPDHRT